MESEARESAKDSRSTRRRESCHDKPEVAEFLAANIVQKGLDYEQGVAAARPDLKPVEVAIVAHHAKSDPAVQQAITQTLKKRGLDGDSKDYFVQRLWSWFDSQDAAQERKTLQAARILGRHFIENQVVVDTPQKLPLQDLSEGLDAMGFTPTVLKSVEAVPVSSVLPDLSEFDEESEEED